jgi:hypothetical protein
MDKFWPDSSVMNKMNKIHFSVLFLDFHLKFLINSRKAQQSYQRDESCKIRLFGMETI